MKKHDEEVLPPIQVELIWDSGQVFHATRVALDHRFAKDVEIAATWESRRAPRVEVFVLDEKCSTPRYRLFRQRKRP